MLGSPHEGSLGLPARWPRWLRSRPPPLASATIAIRCGSLIDGKGDAVRKNVTIVIEGGASRRFATAPARRGRRGAGHRPVERDVPARAHRHAHPRRPTGRHHRRRLRQAAPETIAGVSHDSRHAIGSQSLELRIHDDPRPRDRRRGLRGRRHQKAINDEVIPGPRMVVVTRALDVTGAYRVAGGMRRRCRSPRGPSRGRPLRRAARPCASRSPSEQIGSRSTATGRTSCATTACSTTSPRSPPKS
mgnify:CR=1 FL=1